MIEIGDKEYICALDYAVELIKGKWKATIVCFLNRRPHRFSELQKKHTGISQKMLTEKLRELEDDGLINRTVQAEMPPHVEYCLTKWGSQLAQILVGLENWSKEYIKNYRTIPFIERIKKADHNQAPKISPQPIDNL